MHARFLVQQGIIAPDNFVPAYAHKDVVCGSYGKLLRSHIVLQSVVIAYVALRYSLVFVYLTICVMLFCQIDTDLPADRDHGWIPFSWALVYVLALRKDL